MEKEPPTEKRLKGIPREEIQGKPQDPTGVDIRGVNDQVMPAGGEGLEGGAAGKFTRGFREESEPAQPNVRRDRESVRDEKES